MSRFALLLGALALCACGKVGPPEAPKPDTFPQQYPKAEILPETGTLPPAPKPPTTRTESEPYYSPMQPGDPAIQ